MSKPISRQLTRRMVAFGGILLLTLSTAACFDKEPEQRKAFMTFLQTRILDRPGLRVPILTEKETGDLGPYAGHYGVMRNFHDRLDATVSPDLKRAQMIGRPKSLAELRAQRAAIPMLAKTMGKLKEELAKSESIADAQRQALKQPPELKALYDKAYDKMVTVPARIFREMMPLIETVLPPIEALAVYLDDNRDTIDLSGGQPVIKNAAVRDKLAALIANATKHAEAAAEGQRKLQSTLGR